MDRTQLDTVSTDLLPAARNPCDACPWRLANQGQRHRFGWYTQRNLKRLWSQIRNGGGAQTCHPTDPSHPDHVACGAKEGSTPHECAGSVIVVLQEIRKMAEPDNSIGGPSFERYLKTRARRNGLTRHGILHWCVGRLAMGGVPFVGGRKLPEVDEFTEGVMLPEYLR